MNDVHDVLDHLGYDELRPAGVTSWRPLSEVNGRYGTTDETHLMKRPEEEGKIRLVDAESRELVAVARKGN